nr:type 1 glutamine amidotransferase domain-containing protein [Gordonia humi]
MRRQVATPGRLSGASVAFIVAPEGTEDAELVEPWTAVREAGGAPALISTVSGVVQTFNHLDRANTYPVDHLATEVSAEEFDALVLPGGVANPDYLRTRNDVVGLVNDFFAAGIPVAAVCHAPWTLIDADVVRGRRLTSWPSLRTDLANAGASWVDQPVVTCDIGPNILVTSRGPDDLEYFCSTVIDTIAQSADARRNP